MGSGVESAVGTGVGSAAGLVVASGVGPAVGAEVGSAVGDGVGSAVGEGVGVEVGSAVGVGVGSSVGEAVATAADFGDGVARAVSSVPPFSPMAKRQTATIMIGMRSARRAGFMAGTPSLFYFSLRSFQE